MIKRLGLAVIITAAISMPAMAQTRTSAQGYSSSGSQAIVAPNTTYNSYASGTQTIHDNTQAPDVVVSGANQCALPIGGSTSILGVGVGLAATPTDTGCEDRNDANALLALGLRPESIALMCELPDVKKAAKLAHTTCDQLILTATAAQTPKVEVVAAPDPLAAERKKFIDSLSWKNPGDRPYIVEFMSEGK